MARTGRKSSNIKTDPKAEPYRHIDSDSPMRPEVGTQPQFRKKKPPKSYNYDSSLSPAMDWDGQNWARELGEWLLLMIEDASRLEPPHQFQQPQQFNGGQVTINSLQEAVQKLKELSDPFLNWSGKAERLSFEVPTLPLFVHERLSTKAIIETLKSHRKDDGIDQQDLFELFGDPRHSITDQLIGAYEHRDQWVNRMIVGDSMVVMNSLLEYEGLGGQVQMIYMDPPYGVKFGSNFQPFVRKRDVNHNDDQDMTREPEMVQAYRDTWELGLHSYLTYLRDRLRLSRELLNNSGSLFIQISDENVHVVRALLDEVFGRDNFVSVITFRKTAFASSTLLPSVSDYLLWYAKDRGSIKYHQLFYPRRYTIGMDSQWAFIEHCDGSEWRALTPEELTGNQSVPEGWRIFAHDNLTSTGYSPNSSGPFVFEGKTFFPSVSGTTQRHWKTTPEGLERLAKASRLIAIGNSLRQKRYLDDFPYTPSANYWDDTAISGFAEPKNYVVQTNATVIERCVLMSSDPGDLILDPTCGSGTTAYVSEQWARRWVTIDVSRVPLALARQRILTATFPWFELKDEKRGPAGGFVYKSKQNNKGVEIGGIVSHITLGSIANAAPPAQEILVNKPEIKSRIVRVSGPFCVEATIPTQFDWETDVHHESDNMNEDCGSFVDRMLEVLRKSPVLRLEGNRSITLKNVRLPVKTLSLSAEAVLSNGDEKPVAFVFGPENGAVSEKLVYEAGREAYSKGYTHLYVIGFGIQPNARRLVEISEGAMGVPSTYVQATQDILMGDLLKNMRSSQIFSVCGLPDVMLKSTKDGKFEVELLGMDVFDPVTMEALHRRGGDVPAWFLDTDYNDLCFHVSQAFFPRTSAWDNLKKALKATHEASVWEHLAGTVSAPFGAGEHGQIAVKVIDDRGNELMVVKSLKEAFK
jgi:adenine-specific DNA-methyltransferase